MAAPFIPVNRDTDYLLPPSVQEWLPAGHLVRFVVDVVNQLDLSRLESAYSGRGSTPYPPSVLLGLLIHGYATGVYSSRAIERAAYGFKPDRMLAVLVDRRCRLPWLLLPTFLCLLHPTLTGTRVMVSLPKMSITFTATV